MKYLSKWGLLFFAVSISILVSTVVHSEETPRFDHSHEQFTTILKDHVVVDGAKSGVAYQKLQQRRSELELYLKELSSVTWTHYQSFSKEEQLSFLINAYNGFTLRLVIDNYPIKSIKKIGGLFSNPWKQEFFYLFGEKQTLDKVEHDMIRVWFSEPRIHFVLVCAAKGCPPLRDEAYTADSLEKQLADATETFLGDSDRNFYNEEENILHLSPIFKWYGEDFEKAAGSIQRYLAPYYKTDPKDHERIYKSKISYLNYDWDLNDAGQNR